MKALQIALIILTSFTGCAKKAVAPVAAAKTDTVKTMAVKDTVTYLALGDSYTIGEAVSQAQSYPYQLEGLLNVSSNFYLSAPTIIATTGWTTDNLIDAITARGLTGKYDFVTLLIGVNDQYQGLSQGNYAIKFAQVLNTAISYAHGDTSRVFVLSIPDWGVTPFGDGKDSIIGPEIDQFNSINKAASLRAGVNYLDITAISRQAATNPALVAPDGLHPSGAMYALWMQQLEPIVAAKLSKKQ